MAELNKLLILEESVLLGMIGNPTFVQEFPFMAGADGVITAKPSGCGRCSQKAGRRIQAINGIKQSIVSMSIEKKQKLKQMVNADKVRVLISAGGKVTAYTF
jgi:hypothetical protein